MSICVCEHNLGGDRVGPQPPLSPKVGLCGDGDEDRVDLTNQHYPKGEFIWRSRQRAHA